MPTQDKKKLCRVTWFCVLCLLTCAYGYRWFRTSQVRKEYAVFHRTEYWTFDAGLPLKHLPISVAKPSDQLEAIDLGVGYPFDVAGNGSILIYAPEKGAKSGAPWVPFLRGADGKMRQLQDSSYALASNGRLLEFSSSEDNLASRQSNFIDVDDKRIVVKRPGGTDFPHDIRSGQAHLALMDNQRLISPRAYDFSVTHGFIAGIDKESRYFEIPRHGLNCESALSQVLGKLGFIDSTTASISQWTMQASESDTFVQAWAGTPYAQVGGYHGKLCRLQSEGFTEVPETRGRKFNTEMSVSYEGIVGLNEFTRNTSAARPCLYFRGTVEELPVPKGAKSAEIVGVNDRKEVLMHVPGVGWILYKQSQIVRFDDIVPNPYKGKLFFDRRFPKFSRKLNTGDGIKNPLYCKEFTIAYCNQKDGTHIILLKPRLLRGNSAP